MKPIAYFFPLLLVGCVGPEWNYHQAVDCQKGEADIGLLQSEHERVAHLVIDKKLSSSDTIAPDQQIAQLLGGDFPHAQKITVLDYDNAIELRRNDITATCQLPPKENGL